MTEYDIKEKRYINTPSKYYFTDIGVVDMLEKKDDGKYAAKQVEVDFVANQGSKRYYVQSAFALPTDEKRVQEKRPLLGIKDYFKK